MVRNFGERRKKKNHKKYKGKGLKNNEMEDMNFTEVAIYVPPEQKEAKEKAKMHDSRPSKSSNIYRNKRMERQRLKKDRRRRGRYEFEEVEENNEDDFDFGGEYDEIIRIGPPREAREFARQHNGQRNRYTQHNLDRGGSRYNSYDDEIIIRFSMLDLLVLAMEYDGL